MHNQIFTNGNWNLLPDLGRTAVVAPCNIMKGFLPYARFPEVMGKFSTQRKSAYQRAEGICGTSFLRFKNVSLK